MTKDPKQDLIGWLRQPDKLAFDPNIHAGMNMAADEIERLEAALKEINERLAQK